MAEDKSKFYLCDRWFHLIKEHDDILKYASNKSKPTEGIVVEKHISDNSLDIFYYMENKIRAKISVCSILDNGSEKIFFHYKDIEPNITRIDGEDYANLMIDAFASINSGVKSPRQIAIVNKKRNLKKLCYREAMVPLGMSIDMRTYSLSSLPLDYYLKLVDNFKMYVPMLEYNVNDNIPTGIVKKLVIPNTIYMVDREYEFVENNLGQMRYINSEDSISKLTLNYDYFNNCLESIAVGFKNYGDSKRVTSNCTCKMFRNDISGITVEFFNSVRETININSVPIDGARYRYVAKYDNSHNQISNYLEIEAKRKKYLVYSHPNFSTTYVDTLGNNYHIANQNFARLSIMAGFSVYAFEALEKKLIKEK